MLRAYDANENIVSVTYDLLGRKVALESKDTGRKEWRYDHKGLLEAESDSLLRSKLSEIQYVYDGFDRLIKIDYPFSTDVEYEYGKAGEAGAGEIIHKKDESGEIRYEYGKLSEVVKETRTIKRYEALSEPETATFTYRSDYLGRMQTMKYPDGETITYTYDKGGQLKGVSGVKNTVKGTENYSYIDTIVYDEHGQRVYIKYGNGVETKYRYDDKRRWLKDIETKNSRTNEVFQKITYSFDKVGNVLGYSNDASVYETSQSYTYDSLYQLIGVEGTSNQYKAIKSFGSTPVNVAKYKQDFAFDGIGNMTRKMSTTNLPGARGNAYPNAELDYSLDYEYDPAYAHRLVHAGNRYYRYDANGNITAEKDGPFTEDDEFVFTYSYDPDTDVYGTDYGFGLDAPKETEESHPESLFAYRRNYTWNEKNLLTKSSDRSYTVYYRYGEDGQRALKYTEEGRSETLYFNNFYTIHIPVQDKNNPQGLRVHKHIFVGNSRLVTAMTHTDNNGDNAEQREKRYYYHSDHLGSAQFVTDWRGKQYEHIEYTPYGELWIEEVAAGLDKLPFRFTGKEMDEETGLYYYGARYLDPKYSRWLSGDPALGDYIPAAGTDSSKLAGMGGVFNVVNLHLYHYAGNNPVKYIDPDGKEIENLDPSQEAKLLENITNIAGTGFYFQNNKLQLDPSSKTSGKYSQTARDILIAGISSSKTTYVLPASPEKIQELLPGSYGELGFAGRIPDEPGNTGGVYMVDVPTTQSATDYLKDTFNCTPSEADELGFIHEVLGHAICDMGIPGYDSKTDIMKIERTVREELGWKGVSRSLSSEEADLSGLFLRIKK